MHFQAHRIQSIAELIFVVTGLVLVVVFAPLGTSAFEGIVVATALAVFFYIGFSLWANKGVARRWGFPFSQPPDLTNSLNSLDEDVFGYLLLGGFFIAGAVPMLFLRMIAPQPIFVDHAFTYFLWCGIQDFLFFALVLPSLEDFIDAEIAIPLTALLFGLSHYPYPMLMAVTALAGGIWGYAFIKTRSLTLITFSHWLMGIVLLSN